jgi:protoheme IX farnesyltransferase
MIREKLQYYIRLIKWPQTALLLLTGLTGYLSSGIQLNSFEPLLHLMGSLFLTISGSTILNMVYDRDIDSLMQRTMKRPLPAGCISVREALLSGTMLSLVGQIWAFSISALFGWVVFCGFFIDVIIYTVWLKRRTPWSIVWGGISGGMPILAGRVMGTGLIDLAGIVLSLSVLLWIPAHIMTFNIKFSKDYIRAGIPTFPSNYGFRVTRYTIALSSIGVAVAVGAGFSVLDLDQRVLFLMLVLSAGLISMAVISLVRPSERMNFLLFKTASLYMVSAMILIIVGIL